MLPYVEPCHLCFYISVSAIVSAIINYTMHLNKMHRIYHNSSRHFRNNKPNRKYAETLRIRILEQH